MSYAQGTEHYEFPQFVGSDRPTFVDFNAAFRTIDTKLYGLEGDASTVDGRLDTIEAALPVMDAATQSAQNTADSAKAEADTNAEHIAALEVLTGQHTTQIANKLDSVAIAEQYDPNAGTYNVGAIVVYNGQRYRCTTQVAVAEPFDADKWTGEDVQTVIDDIKSFLSYKSEGYNWVSADNPFYATAEDPTSTFRVRKSGRVVTLNFNLKSKVALTPNVNFDIATLTVDNCKPPYRVVCSVGLYSANYKMGDAKISVNENGSITAIFDDLDTAAAYFLQGEIVYITEN